jgi:POT family proton-dependent oligopeptide transporter
LMAIGYFAMTVHTTPIFFAAMSLIAFGTGFFKPNTTALVGALYAPDDQRRDSAYGLYYMGVNIGSLVAILLCGFLGQKYGWSWGFGAAGVGMVVGLASFIVGRRYLGRLGEVERTPLSLRAAAVPLTKMEKHRIAAIILMGVFGNIAFFATFEQAGSSLSLFAERSTRLTVLGWEMPASWIQVANPVFIILLTPVFGALWKMMARSGHSMPTPAKFATGLMLVAVGFLTMVVAGHLSDTLGPVSLGWLIATYFLHTCGELFASPVGLSMVSRLAPAAYAGRMMSAWFATIAVANLVGGLMAGEYASMTQSRFFMLPMGTAFAASLLLFALKSPITRLMHEGQRTA